MTEQDVDVLVTEWLTLPEVAERLGVRVNRVRQMLSEHQLVAARREGTLVVPAELLVEGKPVKGLPGTLTLLADAGYTDDEALRWLFTDAGLPGSPAQALAENRGTEVKRRAQALGF